MLIRFSTRYRGRALTSSNIDPIYSPKIPINKSWIPPKKETNIEIVVNPNGILSRVKKEYKEKIIKIIDKRKKTMPKKSGVL